MRPITRLAEHNFGGLPAVADILHPQRNRIIRAAAPIERVSLPIPLGSIRQAMQIEIPQFPAQSWGLGSLNINRRGSLQRGSRIHRAVNRH